MAWLNTSTLDPHGDCAPAVRFRRQHADRRSGDTYLRDDSPRIGLSLQDQRRAATASAPIAARQVNDGFGFSVTVQVDERRNKAIVQTAVEAVQETANGNIILVQSCLRSGHALNGQSDKRQKKRPAHVLIRTTYQRGCAHAPCLFHCAKTVSELDPLHPMNLLLERKQIPGLL